MERKLAFGVWLREHRRARDLTQAELGERVGCSAAAIRKFEADLRRPSKQIAVRIAHALVISPEDLDRFVAFARGLDDHWIVNHDDDLSMAVARPAIAPKTYLPTPPAPIVGRDAEITALISLLHDPNVRLVTLTGPGGIGKTRLSLAVAAALETAFADGVAFVDLAPLHDPALVATAIAHALGLREIDRQTPIERLVAYLRLRTMLLVLDNFEHLLPAALIVADLLAAAPGLTILNTSRMLLHLRGEHNVPVMPLRLPDQQQERNAQRLSEVPAAQLFIQRARAAQYGFVMDDESAPMIAAICRHLDGLALAIELAAPHIRTCSAAELLERLTHRLPLLADGPRDAPARHQTLRNTIEWSYQLLDPDAQQLFRRLAVFVGGWTIQMAAAVCAATHHDTHHTRALFDLLLEHHLILEIDRPEDELWFGMLATIHEYAAEQLAESHEESQIRRRHADAMLAIVQQAELIADVPCIKKLHRYHNNIRAALRWLIEQRDASTALQIGSSINWFWVQSGYLEEASAWFADILAIGGEAPLQVYAKALGSAGGVAWRRCEFEQAEQLLRQGLILFRQIGDDESAAWLAMNLGKAVLEQGDLEQALQLVDEASAYFRSVDHRSGIAWATLFHGEIWLVRGHFDHAQASFDESLDVFRQRGNVTGQAWVLARSGHRAEAMGQYREAEELFRMALALFQQYGDQLGIASMLEGLAAILSDGPNSGVTSAQRAALLLGTAQELRSTIGGPVPPIERRLYSVVLQRLRSQLDAGAMNAAWSVGRQLAPEDAIKQVGSGSYAR